VTGTQTPSQTHILRLVAPIGDHRPSIDMEEVTRAIAPRVPFDEGLSLTLEHRDGSDTLYQEGAALITHKVTGFIEHRVSPAATRHLSIFGFAPMPLLMHLGRTVGDKLPAEVYERHRHTDSWCWDADGPALEWTTVFPARIVRKRSVALLLSVSAPVSTDDVRRALDDDFDIVELTLPRAQRVPNTVRTRAQLHAFAQQWRTALNRIQEEYEPARIHLFPAAPLSVCVELGRRLLPKGDPELVVYDRMAGGFRSTLTLRGPEPPRPASTASTADSRRPVEPAPFSALHEFVVDRFSIAEFHTFLITSDIASDSDLPSKLLPTAEFMTEVLTYLRRHDRIDHRFFARLETNFVRSPAITAEIAHLADRWLSANAR
jgi:hypothetical protein